MLSWLLPKTYKHKCHDGSVKVVYRHVDDAFPFYLPGWKAKVDANGKIPVTAQGGIKAEYESKIQGLPLTRRRQVVHPPVRHHHFPDRGLLRQVTAQAIIEGSLLTRKLPPKNIVRNGHFQKIVQ